MEQPRPILWLEYDETICNEKENGMSESNNPFSYAALATAVAD